MSRADQLETIVLRHGAHPTQVLLIDLSAIFRAAWHANENGPTSVSMQATIDGVRRCQAQVPGALVAICCDGKGNWRKELSPDYKAHREKQPESMYGLLDQIKQRLRDDGYLLWTCDGYEADDLIGGATAKARAAGHDVVIASHDKDVTQLVTDHVRMLKTSTWEMLGPAEVVVKFGVEPEYIGDWLALVGDKSDGVKGVPSVGPVTAKELLIKHGGLAGLFAKVDELQVFDSPTGPFCETKTDAAKAIGTPAIVDKLWRHKADALLARKLVELRTDAPVKFEDIYQERTPVTKHNAKTVNLDSVDDVISGPPRTSPANPPETSTTTQTTSSASETKATPSTATAPTAAATTPPSTASAGESTALVPHVEVTYERALEPKSGQGALALGQVLYESRAFVRYPSPGAITAAIMAGRELGFPCMASLNMFQFLAELGCLAPKAHTIIELGMRHPKCKYFRLIHSDYEYAEYETWHADHPEPIRHRYTIQDAVDAGLATLVMVPRTAGPKEKDARGQWDKRRKQMLRKTCGTQLVTIVYPGASMGMVAAEELVNYSDDEADE